MMFTHTSRNEFPIYFLMEAAVNPSDIKTTILRENSVPTADGKIVKTVTADSTLQSFDTLNWNGRRYPKNVIMNGMDGNPKIQNDIRNKQFAGEYCHPDSKEMSRQCQILGPMTSHYIDNYRAEGNLLRGHVTSAPYGYGEYMYNTLMADRPWAFSLRAFGATDSNNVALHPLTIITYDQVNRPSHKEAYATNKNLVLANSYDDNFLRECSNSIIVDSKTITQEITNFVLESSDNVKIAKDLFGLQESAGVFNEKGQIMLEGSYMGTSIKVFVPTESYVRDNYKNLLRGLRG